MFSGVMKGEAGVDWGDVRWRWCEVGRGEERELGVMGGVMGV